MIIKDVIKEVEEIKRVSKPLTVAELLDEMDLWNASDDEEITLFNGLYFNGMSVNNGDKITLKVVCNNLDRNTVGELKETLKTVPETMTDKTYIILLTEDFEFEYVASLDRFDDELVLISKDVL